MHTFVVGKDHVHRGACSRLPMQRNSTLSDGRPRVRRKGTTDRRRRRYQPERWYLRGRTLDQTVPDHPQLAAVHSGPRPLGPEPENSPSRSRRERNSTYRQRFEYFTGTSPHTPKPTTLTMPGAGGDDAWVPEDVGSAVWRSATGSVGQQRVCGWRRGLRRCHRLGGVITGQGAFRDDFEPVVRASWHPP